MTSKTLTLDAKDISEGSFIYVTHGFTQKALLIDPVISNFSPSMLRFLEKIEDIFEYKSSDRTITVSTIQVVLNKSKRTIQRYIKELVSNGILCEVPFSYRGEFQATKSIHAYIFNPQFLDKNELLSGAEPELERLIIEDLGYVKTNTLTQTAHLAQQAKRVTLNKSNHKLLVKTFHDEERKLVNNYISSGEQIKTHGINEIKRILRHSGNFLPEQLALAIADKSKEINTKCLVKDVNGKTHTIPVNIQSFSRILNVDDLQTLFAVITLAYEKVKIKLENAEITDLDESPELFYDITEILKLRGFQSSGTNRQKVRKSLMAIYDTAYNLWGLSSIKINERDYRKYISRTYRNFELCSPLLNKAPEIIDGKMAYEHSNHYVIQLSSAIWNSIINKNVMFAFPKNSLKVRPLIFAIYLRLRTLVGVNWNSPELCYREGLAATKKGIASTYRLAKFKHILLSQFKHSIRVQNNTGNLQDVFIFINENEDEIVFNLWGYKGVIDLVDNMLSCWCDTSEVMSSLALDKTRKTPTIHNEIQLHKSSLMLGDVSNETTSNFNDLIDTIKTRYAVSYTLVSNRTEVIKPKLNFYTESSSIVALCAELNDKTSIPFELIDKKVREDIADLRQLVLKSVTDDGKDYYCSYDDIEYIKTVTETQLDTVSIVRVFARRTSLHKSIYNWLVHDTYDKEIKEITSLL